MIGRLFTTHPHSVGEGYFQHMGAALSFGAELICAGLACLIHAAFPFLHESTGSRTVARLHARMVMERVRQQPAERGGTPATE